MKSSEEFSEDDYDVQFETEVGYITDYFDAVEAYNEDGIVVCDGDKVFTKVRDKANVAMTISKIEERGLAYLDKTTGSNSKMGLQFDRVLEFFSGIKSKSSVVMTYPVEKESMGGNQYLHIDILDEDVQFYCPLLNPSDVSDIPDVDPISCSTQIKVAGSELKKAIKHCMKVESDSNQKAIFRTKGDVLTVSSESKTHGSVDKKFHASGPASEVDLGDHKTTISLGYLNDIKNIIGSADEVTVHIDTDYPIRLDVPIDVEEDAKIIYIIAPRLKEGE